MKRQRHPAEPTKTALRHDADAVATPRPELEPPRGLEAATFEVAGEEFLLLAFPCSATDLSNLTESERQVASELLRGTSYREIARMRGTKVGTVANQVHSIFRKLGIRSRSELASAPGAKDDHRA